MDPHVSEIMDVGRGTGPAKRPLRRSPSDQRVPIQDDGVAPKPDGDAGSSAAFSGLLNAARRTTASHTHDSRLAKERLEISGCPRLPH